MSNQLKSRDILQDLKDKFPIITKVKFPRSNIDKYSKHFSNGNRYISPNDRKWVADSFDGDYYKGFSEHDYLVDNAFNRGDDLHCDIDLWRIYDDAVQNYELTPIDPYEWLFKHATLNDKSIIIDIPEYRILLVRTWVYMEYYNFIHGHKAMYFIRYSKEAD